MDPLPLSTLNDFLYCPRRAWLKLVDGVRGENEHTLLGDLAHAHVDTPGYEQRAGWELLRALPVFSDRLGLSGKADLVEVRRDPAARSRFTEARPVEYKKGPKRRFDNDEVQLCAQALCLEEMFGIVVPAGAIFHAQSQRRTEVVVDTALRARTAAAVADLRALLAEPVAPVAELKPQCEGCSRCVKCACRRSPAAAPRRSSCRAPTPELPPCPRPCTTRFTS
jgi:CRISPR-associated exonuclease Cas4